MVIAIYYPFYIHYAIVSDRYSNGAPNVISLSFRMCGVLEEPWDEVIGNRRVEISPIRGKRPAIEVIQFARSYINSSLRYNLFTCNCEHFVRFVHGLKVESKQLHQAIAGAVFGVALSPLLPKYSLARMAILATAGAVTNIKKSQKII